MKIYKSKSFTPELKLKIKHQYIKDTDYIYQDELSECPIRDIKTTRKYIGTLVFLQQHLTAENMPSLGLNSINLSNYKI